VSWDAKRKTGREKKSAALFSHAVYRVVFVTPACVILHHVTITIIGIRAVSSRVSKVIAPAGISPRGEIPRRHPSSSRVY